MDQFLMEEPPLCTYVCVCVCVCVCALSPGPAGMLMKHVGSSMKVQLLVQPKARTGLIQTKTRKRVRGP